MYAESKIRLFYSTPSCYGRAVQKSLAARELPRKSDDFFPYSSDPHAYWTGYFTSRPTFKGLVRQSSNLLQTCKQLQASCGITDELFQFQRSLAIAQHHDAVTGTAKQHVSNDYTLRLNQAIHGCYDLISDAYMNFLPLDNAATVKQEFCLMLNISQCRVTEQNASFVVTLYNPLSFHSSHAVRLPVNQGSYAVTDSNAAQVPSELLPIPESILRLPGRQSSATHELVFQAVDLPPLGIRSYHIQPGGLETRRPKIQTTALPAHEDLIVSAYGRKLVFDRQTGLLARVGDHNVRQEMLYYQGMAGNNSRFEFRASGAYIFRPNGTNAVPIGPVTRLVTVRSRIVTEVRQEINKWATQIFRLYRAEPDFIETEWIVGPIPVEDDDLGKEVISRFTCPDIRHNRTFHTDSNGREMLERRLDNQPSYAINVTESVAGNYYPVNVMAYIKDDKTGLKMTLLNDRSQGASSIEPGSLEFMVFHNQYHTFRFHSALTVWFSVVYFSFGRYTDVYCTTMPLVWEKPSTRRPTEKD